MKAISMLPLGEMHSTKIVFNSFWNEAGIQEIDSRSVNTWESANALSLYTHAQLNAACSSCNREFLLCDNGANFHIFNSLKYFQLGDLHEARVAITTGNGVTYATKQGTAIFYTPDEHGRPSMVVLENALYLPSCPFSIISEGELASKALANFARLSVIGPKVAIVNAASSTFDLRNIKTFVQNKLCFIQAEAPRGAIHQQVLMRNLHVAAISPPWCF